MQGNFIYSRSRVVPRIKRKMPTVIWDSVTRSLFAAHAGGCLSPVMSTFVAVGREGKDPVDLCTDIALECPPPERTPSFA